jgi:DNA-binding transcriptional regulator YdaS (Cro superfamily)
MMYICIMNWKITRNDSVTALKKAVNQAGGLRKLARAINVASSQVFSWVVPAENEGARPIPDDPCLTIERLYGVRCEELQPHRAHHWNQVRQMFAASKPDELVS